VPTVVPFGGPTTQGLLAMEIGIIGAGWWAAHAYIPLLQVDPRVSAISVCRPDRDGLDTLRSKLAVQHGFEDAAEMLEGRPLAGVIVSSPHVLHAEHALMCIEKRIPVLIEKPMTTSSSDAQRIVAAAAKSQTPVVIAYGWNFRPVAVAALRLARQDWIGNLVHATCTTATATTELFSGLQPPPTRAHLFRPAASTWADPSRAGGYAWGQLTHALGLFFLLVDQAPTGVFARMSLSEAGVDLSDAAVLELDSGASVVISGNGRLPRGRRKQVDIRLFGTEGTLLLDLERERLEATRFDGRAYAEALSEGDGDYGVSELVHGFVDLCAGQPFQNYASEHIGAKAVQVIDAMHRSARSGRFEPI
jgi:predicted dehydrogenase